MMVLLVFLWFCDGFGWFSLGFCDVFSCWGFLETSFSMGLFYDSP